MTLQCNNFVVLFLCILVEKYDKLFCIYSSSKYNRKCTDNADLTVDKSHMVGYQITCNLRKLRIERPGIDQIKLKTVNMTT